MSTLKQEDPAGLLLSASRQGNPRANLTDPESLQAVLKRENWDQVICLAACVRSPDRDTFIQTNVVGMEHLMDGLVSTGFSGRFLLAGSSAVYGELPASWTSDTGVQEEQAPCNPVSAYGETLLERESIVTRATRGRGFSSVITRTFNLLGPDLPAPFAFARFAERTHRYLRGEVDAVEVGSLDAIRDFVDVRDACEAYGGILQQPLPAGDTRIVNVASGAGHPVGAFFPVVEAAVGRSIATRMNPDWVNPREVACQVGQGERIRQWTGWAPRISFEQSVLDLFRTHGESSQESSSSR